MGISGAVHPSANARITGVKTKYKLEQEPEIGVVSGGGVAPSGWDLTGASYDGISLLLSGEDSTPQDVFIRADGLKLFMTGATDDATYRYTLPSAWSLAGGTFDIGQGYDTTSEDTAPTSNFLNPDGTKMYLMGVSTGRVFEYSFGTAWDLSGISYLGVNFLTTGQATDPVGIFWKPDGTKLYVLGVTDRTIYQYSVPVPWSLGTPPTYDGKSFSFNSQDATPQGLFIRPNGENLYITGNVGNSIYQYSFGTAWEVDTLVYQKLFSVSGETTDPQGVFFKEDGFKMYVTSPTAGRVYQYSLL